MAFPGNPATDIRAPRTKPEQPGPFVSATHRTWRLTFGITSCAAESVPFSGTRGLRCDNEKRRGYECGVDDEQPRTGGGKIKTEFPVRFEKKKKIRTYYTEMNHTSPVATVRQPSRSLVNIQVWPGD